MKIYWNGLVHVSFHLNNGGRNMITLFIVLGSLVLACAGTIMLISSAEPQKAASSAGEQAKLSEPAPKAA